MKYCVVICSLWRKTNTNYFQDDGLNITYNIINSLVFKNLSSNLLVKVAQIFENKTKNFFYLIRFYNFKNYGPFFLI